MTSSPVARVGARMIVLDPQNRVLLIEESYAAPERPDDVFHHWLTPGGGVEEGESLREAATREVFEETGVRIVLDADSEPLHLQRRTWSWAGITYDQLDHLFAARVSASFDPEPAALTEMERETVQGARWWSEAELRATDAVLIPPDLADIVARAAADDADRPRGRLAGRMLVIDPGQRVLMVQTQAFPGSPTRHWIAPGGGVESGEDARAAAARELFEETGIRADVVSSQPVATERAVFRFADALYDQTDVYFSARVNARPEVDESGLDEGERGLVHGHRWWSADELRASEETVWPVGLAEVLERINADESAG